MSEKEKKILQIIIEAIPQMDEFQKGYLLGTAEAIVSHHRAQQDKAAAVTD